MKLRITEQSLRFRLRQGEVAALAAAAPLREELTLPTGVFHYALVVDRQDAAAIDYRPDHLEVHLPVEDTRAWAESDRETLAFELATPGAPLRIQVEKDYRCLHRDSDSQADSFPHPAHSRLIPTG